jgi:hypothetical protein
MEDFFLFCKFFEACSGSKSNENVDKYQIAPRLFIFTECKVPLKNQRTTRNSCFFYVRYIFWGQSTILQIKKNISQTIYPTSQREITPRLYRRLEEKE